jgi:hypothetical protein
VAITPEDVQQQIILEVGDVDPATGDPPADPTTGIIATRMHFLWDRYARWDAVAPGLRELYCRAAAIRLVLGVLAPRRFDFSDTRAALSVRAHQLVDTYQQMLEDTTRELVAARKGAAAAAPGGYRGARLVHAAPVGPCRPPDPNALRYGGTVRDLAVDPPDLDPVGP